MTQLIAAGADVDTVNGCFWIAELTSISRGKAGADSEIINVDGDTALIIAVREESIESVRVLLDAGAKVDGLDRKRWTPLVHAATLGLERIAELLVERGADVDARTAGSSTPLHEAAAYGSVKLIQLLLDAGADIEAQDFSNGNTPLLTAAWNGQDGALSELIRHGGRTSALAFYDLGALHRAAQFPQNERVMQLLLDEGIRLDKMSEFGATPANEAARYGNKMNVQFLLTEGADPSLHGVPVCGCIDVETDSSERGCPPGHCRTKADVLEVEGLFARHGGNRTLEDAVAAGDLEEVLKFIEDGSNVNGSDPSKDLEPPLHIAAARGLADIVQVLLGEGAYTEARDFVGWTALRLAAFWGHAAAIQALARGGADLNARSRTGHTALYYTSKKGYLESTQVLIDAGANLDIKTNTGGTALMRAAQYGHAGAVRALLDGGADASIVDKYRRNPLHFAATEIGTEQIMRMLIEEGVDVNSTTDLGTPPIAFAAYYGNIGGVRFLLSMGADPAIGFEGGNTMDDPCGCLGVAGLKDKIRCPRGAACQTEGQIAELEELMGRKRTAEAPRSGDPSLPQRDADSVACESLPLVLQQLECTASADPAK
ncbi:unnamed protein product [Ostreobium quekettii]|uniref:Ankyrin repeat protein n=1 Tax=Ostreobium quekettii TaxID=121088 RepID=A0A8S1ITF9_9CHLO|nr:unnamed protein product [Ostreobium quekettii]